MVRFFIVTLCLGMAIVPLKSQTHNKYNRQVRKTERRIQRDIKNFQRIEGENEEATPDGYYLQEFINTMDPAVGRPTPEVLFGVLEKLNSQEKVLYSAMPGTNVTPWVERGPNNIGGRTRALAWDPWDQSGKKVWAGGITGGLWYNNDITNSNSSWKQVSQLWSNLSVSSIAFDPVNSGTMYIGTGEGYLSTSSTSRGYGIWKSTDSGKTFTWLSSTSNFFYVNDIIVRNESGSAVVYAACDANYVAGGWQGLTSYGLYRSTNGGTGWSNVIGNAPNGQKYAPADLELDASNNLWMGTRRNPYSGADRGGGRILYSTNGTTWTVKYTLSGADGRVELACAPGNAKLLYAVFESGGQTDSVMVSHNGGTKWSPLAKPNDADKGISKWDFARNQALYDLIIAVDPNDTNTVIVGGIDLFRSTNGGSSWSQISKWSNNANLNLLSCSYVHADQHEVAFKPGSSSTVIFGNDGGVFYTSNVGSAASSNVIFARNKDYNVTQFYWGDQGSATGSNIMVAGAQDNGTQYFNSSGMNSTVAVSGGDGGLCFISPSDVKKQVTSYIKNQFFYTTDNWNTSGNLISDATTGSFINPAEWDDNGPGLFTAKSTGSYYRIKLTGSPGSLETKTWTATGNTTSLNAFKLSNGKSRLFIGTDAGTLYVTQDAWATTPSFTDITKTINAGSISDVFNLRSGDTIAAVLSNYGVNNIYLSVNNGSSWAAKDGNLPNQPVWSILLNPDKLGEALVATETGVYGTSNIFASTPVWTAYSEGMGAVKTATLRYRSSDKVIMAATHGRGVFTSDAWARNTPIAWFGADKTSGCSNQTFQFKDSSSNDPTQWLWQFTPSTVTYLNGTDSSSENPLVQFNSGGTYTVKLTATNQLGADTRTRSSYITITDTIAGTVTLAVSSDTICADDSITLNALYSGVFNGFISGYQWKLGSSTVSNSSPNFKYKPTAGESFQVTVTSTKACTSPNPFTSAVVSPVVLPVIRPSLSISAPDGCNGKPLVVTSSGTDLGSNPVYDWFINSGSQSVNASSLTINSPQPGNKVWATVTVAGKCVQPANTVYSDTVTLVVNAVPSAPVVSRNYDTLFASNVGNGTYTWYRNGIVSGNGKVYRAPQNGGYRCVYTENGCNSDSSSLIAFNSLGQKELTEFAKDVWPIPAKEELFVQSRGQEVPEILTTTGVVIHCKHTINGDIVVFDISKLSPGVYLLRSRSEGKITEGRFLKQ